MDREYWEGDALQTHKHRFPLTSDTSSWYDYSLIEVQMEYYKVTKSSDWWLNNRWIINRYHIQ